MENPFEIILERLERIELVLEKLSSSNLAENALLSAHETCELLKISRSSLWKHTKSGKLKSYGIGNRVYYKKEEILQSITRIN